MDSGVANEIQQLIEGKLEDCTNSMIAPRLYTRTMPMRWSSWRPARGAIPDDDSQSSIRVLKDMHYLLIVCYLNQ